MKMSPSSMFIRIIVPVARTTRSGMKFFIVPTTALNRLPISTWARSMIGAPYPSRDDVCSTDWSAV
ncbi:hypothetical protein D3C83_73430 [compost metagenome]